MNLDHGEVIDSEPWAESARDRRMSVAEMRASTDPVFFFRLNSEGGQIGGCAET